ncbi:hypothetical protein M9H77_35016 [Catharanthus roseus]|uniref:Uncharacterized protein n=1 Tax=Catharanthus roseus TaxID=4058 RepID=A0ACB9ZMT3_CATRO|nr:hypothetical protein M9H77_35016 [Catharanthus roseus]
MMMQFHENSSCNVGSLSKSRHISVASTPEFKETFNATVGLHGQSPNSKTRSSKAKLNYQTIALPYHWSKQTIDSWGTYQVCPETHLGGRIPPQSMVWCPRRPIGPHPPQSMPLFKWIHSSKSETSTPSEEALVRRISYVQYNLLTLLNT